MHFEVDLLCKTNIVLSNVLDITDVHPVKFTSLDMEYDKGEIYSAIINDNGVCFLLGEEDKESDGEYKSIYYSKPYKISDIANYFEVVCGCDYCECAE